jgi:hypothetical protein
MLRDAQIALDNDDDQDGLANLRWWGKRLCGYGVLLAALGGFFYSVYTAAHGDTLKVVW